MTRNGVMVGILRYFTEFHSVRTSYIVQVRPMLSATKMWAKESRFRQYTTHGDILRAFQERLR